MSGSITRTSGPKVKRAVCSAAVPLDTDVPMPSASDDEKASMSIMVGWWCNSARLVSSLHMTPDDTKARSVASFQCPGRSSRAARMGLAKASPTMATVFTFSRSTVSSSSTGSKRRPVRVTTQPPIPSAAMEVNAPVPCISGQAGRWTGPAPTMALRTPPSPPSSGTRRKLPAFNRQNRSSWRHMTPLGMPVVPPV